VRIVVADEVDRFPVSAGSEGDPLALASKRQGTFWNRKTLVGSTPTLKETSAIWREWLASDMRHYHVPCHACGHAQALVWSNVRWDKTPDGKHLPATAHYVCESCGAIWTDTDRHDAVAKGQWVASKPDVIGVAGFHITGLLSPWMALADIGDPDFVRSMVTEKGALVFSLADLNNPLRHLDIFLSPAFSFETIKPRGEVVRHRQYQSVRCIKRITHTS
jgi:transposase-like protein